MCSSDLVSHARDASFERGLRSYFAYRDLGIAQATEGRVVAHVIRAAAGTECSGQAHLHHTTFQMVYVLKGWMKAEFEGEGVHTMRAGSCWVQPSGIRHKVLAQSDDMELIEVISPGTFETVNVD